MQHQRQVSDNFWASQRSIFIRCHFLAIMIIISDGQHLSVSVSGLKRYVNSSVFSKSSYYITPRVQNLLYHSGTRSFWTSSVIYLDIVLEIYNAYSNMDIIEIQMDVYLFINLIPLFEGWGIANKCYWVCPFFTEIRVALTNVSFAYNRGNITRGLSSTLWREKTGRSSRFSGTMIICLGEGGT